MPDEAHKLGLDAPIPDGHPGHKVAGVELRRWPTHYVTPRIRLVVSLWRLKRQGLPLRQDGVLFWPGPLVEALSVLDGAHAQRSANG